MSAPASWQGGHRLLLVALLVATIGVAGFVLALYFDPSRAIAGYLVAYTFAATVGIGLLAFIMAAYAIGAGWPVAVRRLVEMALGALPLLVVLYLPLFASARLYPWAHPERVADSALRALLLRRGAVMNAPLVFGRGLVFVSIWAVFAEVLRRGSLAMDEGNAGAIKPRLARLSCWALPIVGLTGTGAAFDWLMSLSPDFYSTMYGLYVLSGGFVAALGLLAVIMFFAARAKLARISVGHWHAVGRLLFAFLSFWAYTAYFQYLLVWEANKPVEAKYFLARIEGDRWTSAFLIAGAFAAPWLLLLSHRVRRSAAWVAALGGWIAMAHYVDLHWLVAVERRRAPWQWHDVPAFLLIAGLVVAVAILRQRGHATEAVHDPDYARGLAYESETA